MTRHFPQWLMLGLCWLPAPGPCGVHRATLWVPCLPAETVAMRTVSGKKSHGGPRPERVPRGVSGDALACIDVVLERTP